MVRVEITVDSGPPPSGNVKVDGGPGRRFEGWLGLLHILSAALEPERPADPLSGLGGEPVASPDPVPRSGVADA